MQKVDYQYDDSRSMWKIEMVIFVCVVCFCTHKTLNIFRHYEEKKFYIAYVRNVIYL